MIEALWVGVGAFLGAIARWGLTHISSLGFLPLGTLLANWIGSFCIGLVLGYASWRGIAPQVRLFVVTGFLGGLTTLSTFSWESIVIWQRRGLLSWGMHFLLHTLGSIAMTVCAMIAIHHYLVQSSS